MQLPSKIFCLSTYTIIICCILLRIIFPHAIASDSTFIPNYYAHWGLDHFTLLQEGSEEVQLLVIHFLPSFNSQHDGCGDVTRVGEGNKMTSAAKFSSIDDAFFSARIERGE